MDWLQHLRSHPYVGAFVCGGLAVLSVLLRQVMRRTALGPRLNPSFGLIGIGLIFGAVAAMARVWGVPALTPYLDAVFIGAVAIGAVRAALTLFVEFYLRQREGAVVSAIFRDIATIVTYFIVIVFVLRSTLDINLASLVATSAVLTAIIGLALQDLLSNLFSGLVLELEAPFSYGDWVRVGAFEGIVQETGWRTTKLRTRVNEIVTLPNAMLSKEPVVNYSRPDPLFGDTLHFEAAYEIPPNVVKDAVQGVFDADPAVARTPPTEVRLLKFGESGVGYAVRYWITDYGELERTRNRLHSNLWYAFRRGNVRIPFPARDLFVYAGADVVAAAQPDLAATLRGVPLFAPLDDTAIAQLAAGVRRVTFGCGEVVVREGDSGDSFYVIDRGAAEVTLDNGGRARTIGQLQAGSFFGEMSLLAGEPRTATVRAVTDLTVLRIDREAFREIIAADPALLGPLSEIVTGRQSAQQEHRRLAGIAAPEVGQQARQLRERIKAFFGL